jgi:DsbC/DsbD-like thiol-disulfide interchange protein
MASKINRFRQKCHAHGTSLKRRGWPVHHAKMSFLVTAICQFASNRGYIGNMNIFALLNNRPIAAFSILFVLAGFCGQTGVQAGSRSGSPPARSQWDESDYSRVRLMLIPGAGADIVSGGVEIQLEPGWHTYWRVPGDAGVPPQFDFSDSQNVADVQVEYPVPHRYHDGVSVSVIYKDRVVFPITVRPVDPGQPVVLSLNLFYGACADVCIPVKAVRTASLAPGDNPDRLARIAIAEYRKQLPQTPVSGFMISSVTQEPGGLLIKTALPRADNVDLFAEAPEDWFIGQPELVSRSAGGALFRLSLKGIPEGAKLDGAFDFLLVADNQGVLAEKVRIDHAN